MELTTREHNGVICRAAAALAAAGGVAHGFSTRVGGVSEGIWASLNLGSTRGDDPARVLENYRRFCAAVGTDVDAVVMSNQVHGDVIRAVTRADIKTDFFGPEGYEADGLMTNVPGLALTVFAADCTPILLYDPTARAIAALHAGWRGTALGIAAKAVEKMAKAYGSKPENLLAAIGPCLSVCCFETDRDVPDAMAAAMGEGAQAFVHRHGTEKYKVDLKGLNALQLERAGLPRAQIVVDDHCTMCRPDLYWSHRATQGQRGSQAAMIALI